MPPVRCSALNVAEHCDLAPTLAAEFPHARAAAERGRAVDAQASAELSWGDVATDDDAKALAWWVREHMLAPFVVQRPVLLLDPESDEPFVLTAGTPDLVGRDKHNEQILTVVDYKSKGQYWAGALPPPDLNLQLHGYGISWATSMRLDETGPVPSKDPQCYQLVILLFDDGAVQELRSKVYEPSGWAPILDRIRKIALREKARGDNRAIGTSGPHCVECYSRRHCAHWVLPAMDAETELTPLATSGGLTRANSERALRRWMQLGELYDQLKPYFEEFALHDGPIPFGEEKQWGPQVVRGRRSATVSSLEAAGLTEHIRQGEPTTRFTLRRR